MKHFQKLVGALGHAYALSGEAIKTLDELREMSRHRYISPYLFAVVNEGEALISQRVESKPSRVAGHI